GLELEQVCYLPPLEFSIFWVGQKSTALAAHSDAAGSPVIARPIFAAQPDVNAETVFLSSFPGLAAGGVTLNSSSRLWGFEVNAVGHTGAGYACGIDRANLDVFLGFRYLDLEESLTIGSTATPLDPAFAVFFQGLSFGPGNTTVVGDSFRTTNEF